MLGAVGVVGVWLDGSAGGLRADDGGRTGALDVGVLDLRVAQDVGLESGWGEVDVLSGAHDGLASRRRGAWRELR